MTTKKLVKYINKNPMAWNGKIYKKTVYVKGFKPYQINKKMFIKQLNNENLLKYNTMIQNSKLNLEFKQFVKTT